MSGLTSDDLDLVMETVANAMRDLSVRVGPYEYAVPLARGVDLVIAVNAAVEQIITARLDEFKARAVAAIEAQMGRDSDYDDGMEDAANVVAHLT